MSQENGQTVKKKRKTRTKRYIWVFCGFCFLGIWVIFQMCRVMFIDRQFWQDVDKVLTSENRVIDARRGDILSDEGLLLASSMKQYRVFLDFASSEKDQTRKEKDQTRKDTLFTRHLDVFAAQMHDLFPEYTVDELKAHYQRGYQSKSHSWVLLPHVSRNSFPISYNRYKALAQTDWLKPKYEYWFFSSESKISRKKPFGALAARTIGSMYESKDSAKNGLELAFDSLLRGVPGKGHVEKVQNVSRTVADVMQIDGCDVHTTINVDIQDIVETALRRQLDGMEAVSGTAVVMEVPTGDIKAMASLTATAPGQYEEIQNNVVMEVFEPGSTFKPVSMMVALDDGKFKLTDSVFCENGSYRGFGGAEMTDGSHGGVRGYGWLDVQHIIMNSCNIGTAKLINGAYGEHPEEFVDGVYRTGINTHFTLQLQGGEKPVIRRDGYWDKTRLPWMAIGYNTQLPVINTLAFYNGVANGGCMVAPRLVREVTREGVVVQEFPVEVVREHMCKESTLKQIQFLLEQVVEGGTGKRAGSQYFKVAGKTGTAQMSQGSAGYKNGGRSHMVSFCGYFPADRPMYSCIVSIRTSTASRQAAGGGSMAAPVFHELSEKIMSMSGYRDMASAKDTVNEFMPAVLSGNLARVATVLDGLDMEYARHWPAGSRNDSIWGTVSLEDGKYVAAAADYENGLVPDVRGMGAQDAMYLLEKLGMKVSMTGVGHVRRQSLMPGYKYHKGETIQITLGN